jgi:TPR repeat protein
VNWYRKAADQGFATAQLHLGGMYFLGHGVPQDYVAALAAAGEMKKRQKFGIASPRE